MAVTYDRDKAVGYALRFWDKPCNDRFLIVADRKPNPKFQSLQYVPAANFTRIDPGSSNLLNRDGTVLIEARYIHDAAHFVCCCIGDPPGEHAGGLNFGPWDRSGKKPYGDLLIADLVRRLEADKRFETLLDESKNRTPPGSMEKGDVVAYWDKTLQAYTDVALYVGEGRIAGHSPLRGPTSGTTADWDYPHEHVEMRWTVFHVRTVKGKVTAAGTTTLKTQPFKVFTLFEHYWADPKHDDEAWNIQQAVPLTPEKMNPGFWDGAGVKTDQDFRDKVREAAQEKFSQDPPHVLKALRYAVAKIGPGSAVSYAGNHLTDTRPEEKYKSSERRDLESLGGGELRQDCAPLRRLPAALRRAGDGGAQSARIGEEERTEAMGDRGRASRRHRRGMVAAAIARQEGAESDGPAARSADRATRLDRPARRQDHSPRHPARQAAHRCRAAEAQGDLQGRLRSGRRVDTALPRPAEGRRARRQAPAILEERRSQGLRRRPVSRRTSLEQAVEA